MSNQTVEGRLEELELALMTSMIFHHNALAALARGVAAGDSHVTNEIAQQLEGVKGRNYQGIDNTMHDSYVDALISVISGKP
ncbi:hypothetical protein [Pseudomonas amygdali]|uniref:hypothetical protein n=1 Tax=Pseudomonas amygdali TaxID=47877 RepID=UPI0006B8CC85|nr:hypothetical protein [Pseudomonas amygdali]PPS33927.1 hypothetical protein BVY10_04575 [Pseudomonas amygdali pv. morsprunorum]